MTCTLHCFEAVLHRLFGRKVSTCPAVCGRGQSSDPSNGNDPQQERQGLGESFLHLVGMMLMAWKMLRNHRHWILFSWTMEFTVAHELTAIHHLMWGFALGKVCILVAGPDFPTSVLCGILKLNVPQMLLGTTPVIIVSIIPQACWKMPKDLDWHRTTRLDHVTLTLPKIFRGSNLDGRVSLSTNWYTRLSGA